MKKNWLAVAVAAVIAAGSIAGCGSSTGAEKEAAAESSTEAEAASAGETMAVDEEEFSANPVLKFAGPYMDENGADYYLDIEAIDGETGALVEIYTNIDDYSFAYWQMTGQFNEKDGTLTYTDGVKKIVKEDEESGENDEETVYEDGTGVITIRDNKISWKEDKEDAGKDLVFVWDQETADYMAQIEEAENSAADDNSLMVWMGPYEDRKDGNLTMFIDSPENENADGKILITKTEGDKQTEWMMDCTYDEATMTIEYKNCVKSEHAYTDGEDAAEQKVLYEDGSGRFKINEDGEEEYITWTDDKENAGEGVEFVFSFEFEDGDNAEVYEEEDYAEEVDYADDEEEDSGEELDEVEDFEVEEEE